MTRGLVYSAAGESDRDAVAAAGGGIAGYIPGFGSTNRQRANPMIEPCRNLLFNLFSFSIFLKPPVIGLKS
jgi:hypothetical protein